MKREFNDDLNDEEMDYGEDDNCPYLDITASLILTDKPFGFMWPLDKMINFLKARGYKILDRKNKNTGEEYTIACNPENSSIPSEERSNIKEVFDSEVQDIILKWLLTIC